MMFSINDKEFWELVQIEEETNCDISAGADLGPHQARVFSGCGQLH